MIDERLSRVTGHWRFTSSMAPWIDQDDAVQARRQGDLSSL